MDARQVGSGDEIVGEPRNIMLQPAVVPFSVLHLLTFSDLSLLHGHYLQPVHTGLMDPNAVHAMHIPINSSGAAEQCPVEGKRAAFSLPARQGSQIGSGFWFKACAQQ